MNEQEFAQTKVKMRQYRVRANFDKTYHSKGGLQQLERMVAHADTLEEMSKWFGPSSTRMSVILQDVLGMTYTEYLLSKNVRRSGVIK